MDRSAATGFLIGGRMGGLAAGLPGLVLARQRFRFLRTARKARGKVVGHREGASWEDAPYVLTIEFEEAEARLSRAFVYADSPPPMGTEMAILYDPSRPVEVLVDSAWAIWSLPLFLLGAGLVCLAAGVSLWLFWPAAE